MERQVKERELHNVQLLPFQRTDDLASSLSMGDVHVVTLRNGFTGLVVPSKAYGSLAVGKPIIYIGEPDGEIARMVMEEAVGRIVPGRDFQKLREAVLEYYENLSLRMAHGKKALEISQDKYNRKISIGHYLRLFEGVKG